MKLILFLLKYSRGIQGSRMLLAVVIFTGVLSGISNTALLAVINSAFTRGASAPGTLIITFICLCLVLPLSRFVSEILLVKLAAGTILDLRLKMGRHILGAPLRQLEELGTHRLLATLTEDIPTITNALTAIPVLCINVAVVVAALAYLGWLSPVLLLILLGLMALGTGSYYLLTLKAMTSFRLMRDLSNTLFKHFRALTEGAKELKLHYDRREAFFKEALQPTAESLLKYNVKGNRIYSAANCWGQVLIFILIGFLLFALPAFKAMNSQIVNGYILALLYMMTPLQIILTTLPIMGRAKIAGERIEELGTSLSGGLVEKRGDGANRFNAHWQTLDLIGVTHEYRSESGKHSFTLGPLHMSFRSAELVFVIGGNGSGKTTFAKVLTGLYAPEGGEIRVDGEPITDQNREAYRQQFSAIFSDFFIFDSLLGLYKVDLETKIEEHLALLQLAEKITIEKGALSTTDLSRGQRKRLALLTAYLEDRPFYVFDEWAADQDPVFKEFFYYQMLPELKARGKTVLVISHDDRYYHVADRIIKLDYGKMMYDQESAGTERAAVETPKLV
jgi:putative ATP-binding cassette transporter